MAGNKKRKRTASTSNQNTRREEPSGAHVRSEVQPRGAKPVRGDSSERTAAIDARNGFHQTLDTISPLPPGIARNNIRPTANEPVEFQVEEAREQASAVQTPNPSDVNASVTAPRIKASKAKHEEFQLEQRIRSAINYAHSTPAGSKHLMAHEHFKLHRTNPPSTSFRLLRDCDLAELVNSSPTHVTFSLPMSAAPPPSPWPGEQWWVGLSPAEVLAGPVRDAADIKKAESRLREKDRREEKKLKEAVKRWEKGEETVSNDRLEQERRFTREGLKRQILGFPMNGDPLAEEQMQAAMAMNGDAWREVEAELDREERERMEAAKRKLEEAAKRKSKGTDT